MTKGRTFKRQNIVKVEHSKGRVTKGRTFKRQNFLIFEKQEIFLILTRKSANFFKIQKLHFWLEFSMERLVTYFFKKLSMDARSLRRDARGGQFMYRIHSLKYLRSIRHRVANIKGLEIRKSQFVAKTKFPSKMKRIRNVVFRFFLTFEIFFLNWKILPFERSTFSLFYLLIVLPFVVLPYNRSTFFHSTFFQFYLL